MAPHSIIELSQFIGSNFLLSQGIGGNTSLKDKDNNIFWIKASGKRLISASNENIFASLDLKAAIDWFENSTDDIPVGLGAKCIGDHSLRPSIETSLHLLFDKQIVAHMHPINILCHAVQTNCQVIFDNLLGDLNWAFIPYVKPGRALANSIRNYPNYTQYSIFVLQNHGLIITGNTTDEVKLTLIEVLKKCEVIVDTFSYSHDSLASRLLHTNFRLPTFDKVNLLALRSSIISKILLSPNVVYPDQAVFLGESMSSIDSLEELSNFRDSPFLIYPGNGVLINRNSSPLIEEMLLCHAEILSRIPDGAEIRRLSSSEIFDLLQWDAEKFRKSSI